MRRFPMMPPEFSRSLRLDDGTDVTIRTIRPEDRDIEQNFVRSLSARSSSMRFFSSVKELSPATLKKFTEVEYPKEMALIATVNLQGTERQIGVARYAPGADADGVEFAVVVADEWQGFGIGTTLLRHLFGFADESGANHIEGFILCENERMLALAREFGFAIRNDTEDPHLTSVYKNV